MGPAATILRSWRQATSLKPTCNRSGNSCKKGTKESKKELLFLLRAVCLFVCLAERVINKIMVGLLSLLAHLTRAEPMEALGNTIHTGERSASMRAREKPYPRQAN